MRAYSSNKEIFDLIANTNTIGLVPTMGSLHEGHLTLIKKAIAENEKVIVSIYVNPTQFNNLDDLEKYPRNLDEDLFKLKDFAELIVYAPDDNEFYGKKKESKKYDFGKITTIMEGKFRPGHFDGVATIIEKLFKLFQPKNAYFGEKDYQQLLIIKSLNKKLNSNINIIGCKTIRENDGLAMSSRNKMMTKEERKIAGKIIKLLFLAQEMYGNTNLNQIKNEIINQANSIHDLYLEYFEIIDFSKFFGKYDDTNEVRAFIACKIGNIRLIDNIKIEN